MILPGHPGHEVDVDPVIRGTGGRNQRKYVFNVLKHVLGYRYRHNLRNNEGWHRLLDIDDAVRLEVDLLMRRYGYVSDYSQGWVDMTQLKEAAHKQDICRAVQGLVNQYARAVEDMVRDWDVDFHEDGGGYSLIDTRGGVFCGEEEERVRAKTAYRWCEWDAEHARLPDAIRADKAYEHRDGEACERIRP